MYDVIYAPVLRAKDGELTALAQLSPFARTLVRPFLDIPPAKQGDPVDQHLADVVKKLAEGWGTRDPVFIDLFQYGPEERTSDGLHPAKFFFECARQKRLKFIPVTGPLSVRGPTREYIDAVSEAAALDHLGHAIRLPFERFVTSARLISSIDDSLSEGGLRPHDADLILDVGGIERLPESEQSLQVLSITLREAVRAAAQYPFRSITIVSSNNQNVGVKQGKYLEVIPRLELRVWRILAEEMNPKNLIFGDYSVISANQSDPDGPVIAPARVRISSATHYYLYKGKPSESRLISRQASESHAFADLPECWGKAAIRRAGSGASGSGNPTDWVARDINVHIEQTARLCKEHLQSNGLLKTLRVADEASQPWLQPELL